MRAVDFKGGEVCVHAHQFLCVYMLFNNQVWAATRSTRVPESLSKVFFHPVSLPEGGCQGSWSVPLAPCGTSGSATESDCCLLRPALQTHTSYAPYPHPILPQAHLCEDAWQLAAAQFTWVMVRSTVV